MPEINGTFNNYSFAEFDGPFVRPEDSIGEHLYGEVSGHQRFYDGEDIHTSTIVSLDLENNLVHTLNSIYKLGTPSKAYSDWLAR